MGLVVCLGCFVGCCILGGLAGWVWIVGYDSATGLIWMISGGVARVICGVRGSAVCGCWCVVVFCCFGF